MYSEEKKSDIFIKENVSPSVLQNDFLGIGVTSKFMLIANKKNELFCWIFDQDESLRTAIQIPLPEKEKGYQAIFYTDKNSLHSIFKYNRYYFYFNTRAGKVKLLNKLNDLNVESIAFDNNANDACTNTILIGTDKGKIYGLYLEYDFKNDKIVSDKLTELIQLKYERRICGLSVSLFLL